MGQVVDAILAKGGVAIITADHGNADLVVDEHNKPLYSPYHQSRTLHYYPRGVGAKGRWHLG